MGLSSLGSSVGFILFLFLPLLPAVDNLTANDVLAALERTVNYYVENHRNVNLDGIYGLRVVEGQTLQILSRHSAGRYPHLSPSVVARLQTIHRLAQNISESALPFLRSQDKSYYFKLKPLVDSASAVFHSYRRLDHSLRWSEDFQSENAKLPKFDEQFSDRCMTELMGTQLVEDDDKAMEQDGVKLKCKPTSDCLRVMFSRGREEYELTHQLLYTVLAEQMDCLSVLDQWLSENEEPLGVKQMQLEWCTNNFAETQEKISLIKGNIYPIYQDLFMEQQFVCPVLGFMEFLHMDWLKQILSWQQPSGCFGKMSRKLPLDVLAEKHVDYSYDEPINQQDAKDQHMNVALHTRHVRDQFGVKDSNAFVRQTNESKLEMHLGPEDDLQDHQKLNNQAVPQFEQRVNDRMDPGRFDQVGQTMTTNSQFPFRDVNRHDGFGAQNRNFDQLEPGRPTLSSNDLGNIGQGQDRLEPNRMEPFGGNVQGFQRDEDEEDEEEGEGDEDLNPKMLPIARAANEGKRVVKPGNPDKEYEQYIDEEDEPQNLALNVGKSEQRHNAGFQKDNIFDLPNKQHGEEESYSYYDNQEDHPEVLVGKNQKIVAVAKDIVSSNTTPHLEAPPLVSPTKLYLFVTAFTVVILYFMFKFVRRRRVVIRYYHH